MASGALERAHADLHATLASHEKHKADSRAALSAVEDQVHALTWSDFLSCRHLLS